MNGAALDLWIARRMGIASPPSRAAIEAMQGERLAAAVARARTASPFYRSRRDWPASPVASLGDLPDIPFTTPTDLARNDPPLVAVSQSEVDRIVTLSTSGTSGPPKRVFFSADDREATLDFFHHGMAGFTRPGDVVVIAFAGERPGSVGAGLAEALARLGAVPLIAPTEAGPESLADVLRTTRATVVAGPPVRLLAAARVSATDGGPPISLRAALVSSDHAAASVKRGLARIWGCEVFDHWGMTETGLGGAVECGAHAGLHLREADLLIEVVDPMTGVPMAEGEMGEVVLTTLAPRALPLLRYRTGDRARLRSGRCACGSVLRRLDGFEGRIDADVGLPGGGRLSMPLLDEALFSLDDVCDFTATWTDGPPARLHLRIALSRGALDEARSAALRRALTGIPDLGRCLAARSVAIDLVDAAASICRHDGKRRLRREEGGCASSA